MDSGKRDYLFDNAKVILIFLVLLGHCLEEISIDGYYGAIRAWIYSFHMPAFVFISGYFSKNIDEAETIKNCLIPFFIFNTVYAVLAQHKLVINVFSPIYIFWYLLSLFFWRISIRWIDRIRGILLISIVIAVIIGLTGEAGRFLSVSRTFSFFPYFLIGYLTDRIHVSKVRRFPKILCIWGGIILTVIVVMSYIWKLVPVLAYECKEPYADIGMGNLEGCVVRLLLIIMGMLAIACFIILVPDKQEKYTFLGARTVSIYVLSGFTIKILFKLLGKVGLVDYVRKRFVIGVAVSGIISILTMIVLGSSRINGIYKMFTARINGIIIK